MAPPETAPSPAATPAPSSTGTSTARASARGVAPRPKPAKKATPAPAPSEPLPALLRDVEVKYASAQTLTAHFSQVVQGVVSKQKQTSRGIIKFKRPDKIRWETQEPDANLFISNGVTAWYYQPPFDEGDRGQYHERKASEVQTKLANALLSGSFSAARDMRI